jgi:nitrogen-specific signal transduction histidine kinase
VTVYPLVANGAQGAVIRVDDITERVRIEEMMVQSEKMLSVGGLAAGMAHEINNPLAGMVQTATVMANRISDANLPANREATEAVGNTMETITAFMDIRGIPGMLENIRQTGHRAAEIVSKCSASPAKAMRPFPARTWPRFSSRPLTWPAAITT